MRYRDDDRLSSSQFVEEADRFVGLHPDEWPSSSVAVRCVVPGGMGSAVEVAVRTAGGLESSLLGGSLDLRFDQASAPSEATVLASELAPIPTSVDGIPLSPYVGPLVGLEGDAWVGLGPLPILRFVRPTLDTISPRIPDAVGEDIVVYGSNLGVAPASERSLAAAASLRGGSRDDGSVPSDYWRPSLDMAGVEEDPSISGSDPASWGCYVARGFFESAAPTVLAGNTTCLGAELVAPSRFDPAPQIRCSLQASTVGGHELSVDVAMQSTGWSRARFVRQCKEDWYGIRNETCLECPDGGACEGALADPTSLDGWWRSYAGVPTSLCPEERQEYRVECPHLEPCIPPEACLANNTCAGPYQGARCLQCKLGYYRRDGTCVECPDNAWVLMVVFGVGAIALAITGYVLSSKRFNM